MHGQYETPDPIELFHRGVQLAFGPRSNPSVVRRIAAHLPPWSPSGDIGRFAAARLDEVVDHAFAAGWQPAELMHTTKRRLGTRPSRLVLVLVAAHADRTAAHTVSPIPWREQLPDVPPSSAHTVDRIADWRTSEKIDDDETWSAVLTVVAMVGRLAPLPPLVSTPSSWGTEPPRATGGPPPEPKVLKRIRGLLAKAEATTFAEEADTYAAKAQELMTRYTIDSAIVDADAHHSPADSVITRRLLVDNPYPEAKIALLNSVGTVNGAKVLWHRDDGLASIVGLPADLDLCDLLFTSLLVQSARALREHPDGAGVSVASFRRSFLLGYAYRIAERLTAAQDRARTTASRDYGRDLVPVFAGRDDAVQEAMNTMFPEQKLVAPSLNNGAGVHAGRRAADNADLTGGRDPLTEGTRNGYRS
ncbi:MAG: DUF2786 domain-containing protein [Rhodococcus sp. (in: high G+C Gram-positive bacteria)]